MARKQRSHLTTDELLDVLQAAKDDKNNGARDFALLLVVYRHALRASEASNLRLSDVKPNIARMQELSIARLKGSLHTVQSIDDHAGVPLLCEKRALKAWLAVRPNDGSDYLFNSQKGGGIRRESLCALFVKYCETASLRRVERAREAGHADPESQAINDSSMFIHNLKHSRMQHLVGKTDLYNLKSIAGHRAISSTMAYLSPDQKAAMAEARRVDMTIF